MLEVCIRRLTSRPINPMVVINQARNATYTKYRGITYKNVSSVALANWNVLAVYMPRGKTIPQYSGW